MPSAGNVLSCDFDRRPSTMTAPSANAPKTSQVRPLTRQRLRRPRPDHDRARSVVATAALNAAVERIARRDPAQYQWTYKRYTLQPSMNPVDNPYRDLERRRHPAQGTP